MNEILKNKKLIFGSSILILSSLGYYLNNLYKIKSDSNDILGNIGFDSLKQTDSCSRICFDDINKILPSDTQKADFSPLSTSLWFMRLHEILIIISLILISYNNSKYDKIIAGLLGIAGIFGILIIVYADSGKNNIIKTMSDSKATYSLEISLYLIIISSILCIAFAGLIFTKKI
jgi:hypothetical protein